MTHRVNYTIQNIDERDSNFRLIEDRKRDFHTFNAALRFAREIKSYLKPKEALFGKPEVEAA